MYIIELYMTYQRRAREFSIGGVGNIFLYSSKGGGEK